MLYAVQHCQPEPIAAVRPTIPEPVGALIDHLLEKDPARRPQSAHDLIEAIEQIAPEVAGCETAWEGRFNTKPIADAPTLTASQDSEGRRNRGRRAAAFLTAIGLVVLAANATYLVVGSAGHGDATVSRDDHSGAVSTSADDTGAGGAVAAQIVASANAAATSTAEDARETTLDEDGPESSSEAAPILPAACEQVATTIWNPVEADRRDLPLLDAFPLQSADRLRLEVNADGALYVYAVLLTPHGTATPLYPRRNGQWERLGDSDAIRQKTLPDASGWPLVAGAGGYTLVVVLRSTPTDFGSSLQGELDSLAAAAAVADVAAAFEFCDGRFVRGSSALRPPAGLVNLHRRLDCVLRDEGDTLYAISFPH